MSDIASLGSFEIFFLLLCFFFFLNSYVNLLSVLDIVIIEYKNNNGTFARSFEWFGKYN